MKNSYGEFAPHVLTDDQHDMLQKATDTLFTIAYGFEEKANPVEARLCNALTLICSQLDSVLNADLSPLKD